VNSLIESRNLTKIYNGRAVVKGIDCNINKGETIALIGSNGAGKTTTISMLLGIIKPDQGIIDYWTDNFKQKIGTQLQSTPFFDGYTVEDNLKLFSAFYNVKLTEKIIDEKLESFDLLQFKNTPAIKLSLGQQKRLAIIVTTLHDPKLVILDEPSAGLDPRGQKETQNLILNLKKKGTSVLFSSHYMAEVEKVADRIIVMSRGEIVAEGLANDLLEKFSANNLEDLYYELTK
jgi:ABC-2 type transport system ATP-binding protein